ncbi:MAG: type I-U CRISPR-associated protein Csb2 [Desulfurellaceae bacterium]|nr:type I-U CRISPR-associated protein Csb2 [Desulfurellaceae bacterium]
MSRALLLSIRFHDGRYHGTGDWPPAPARLFQALVAGTAKGSELSDTDKAALEWLETLEAPVIAAPAVRAGRAFKSFVPNNDLDKYGGDVRKINKIRTPKTIHSHIFNVEIPLLFIWKFTGNVSAENYAQTICRIAERLYQLGRGVDMAWTWAEILDAGEIAPRLARHGGVVYRPSQNGTGKALLCPKKGSLASLKERYDADRTRFTSVKQGRKIQQIFSQSPKPRFATVAYATPSRRFLFEIRAATSESFAPWPSERVTGLVLNVRDKAVSRLKEALPEAAGTIDRVLIGRNATEADKAARVRILPLPSIGHNHADHAVRRVLIDVPSNCPLRADDIGWAFSGLTETHPTTGEILWNLIRSEEHGMLEHYGIDDKEQHGFRVWRTVTPVALPVMRTGRETTGAKRVAGEAKAARAVMQALRHIGVSVPVASIRVQREPFDRNGARAEEFAMPERYVTRGLHHVEIAFSQAVRGPLVIGNGRYLGLGLMAPRKDVSHDALAFSIASRTNIATTDSALLLHAVRRALMALSEDKQGRVPRLFSGHEPDGAPAGSGRHEHIFLATDDTDEDGRIDRLIVAAPWACDRTTQGSREDRTHFDGVVPTLTSVRAGPLGVLTLGPAYALATGDPLVGPSRVWESRTLYRPTRHTGRSKRTDAFVVQDIISECERRGLPKPEAELLELNIGPNCGLAARVRLRFAVAVEGPVMLGRDSHKGGGLFGAVG